MRRTFIGIGLLAILTSCGQSPTGPARPVTATPRLAVGSVGSGAGVERSRYEQSVSGVLELCGSTELVDVEITVVTRMQTVLPAAGGSRFTLHMVADLRGTGVDSGLQYLGHETWNETVIYPDMHEGAAATRTWNVRIRIVTQGSADDIRGVIHVKRTINANGVLTADIERLEGECVGA